jgi:hypothetical protein
MDKYPYFLAALSLVNLILLAVDYKRIDENGVKHPK